MDIGRVRFASFLIVLVLSTLAPLTALAAGPPSLQENADTDTTTILLGFPTDPQAAIRAARELIAAGNMMGAIKRMQLYVAEHPGSIPTRRFLGDLYFRTGQVDRAATIYEAILRDAPGDKETHNRLGTVYAEENRIDEAIQQFTSALPGTDSVDDLVELHRRKGDLVAYEGEVQTLARTYGSDPDIQAELGQLYYALREPALAATAYLHALDEDPSNLTALNGLGLAYLNLHEYDESVAIFRRCLRVDPTVYQCVNNMGAAQLEGHQLAAAKATLDRAFHLAPERGETFVNYGYLADEQNDWQRATGDYGKAIELYPYLREAYIDLAVDYERHQLYVLAQAVLVKGMASVHDDGRLHVLLGDAYQAQGDRVDALAQYRLGLQGTDPDAVSVATQRVSLLTATATAKPQ